MIYEKINRKVEAKKCYEKVLSILPNDLKAKQALEALN